MRQRFVSLSGDRCARRRLGKTDAIHCDLSAARAVQAEPTLGPAQVHEVYDPLVAKVEAVKEACSSPRDPLSLSGRVEESSAGCHPRGAGVRLSL